MSAGEICAVAGCSNNARNCRGKNVNFHGFPINPKIRPLWLKALNKAEDWVPRRKLRVCSNHFTPTSYSSASKRNILKRTAVPSVWGPISYRKIAKLETIGSGKNTGTSSKLKTGKSTAKIATGPIHCEINTAAPLQQEVSFENGSPGNPAFSLNEGDIFHMDHIPDPSASHASTNSSEAFSGFSYQPSFPLTQKSEGSESSDEYIGDFVPEAEPHKDDKYLVFFSQLLLLFKFCRREDCQNPIVHLSRKVSGTCLTIKTECVAGHEDIWESQTRFGLISWGNYLLAASIFYSGEIPAKVLRVFKIFNMKVFSVRMYYLYERMFHPIIEKFWIKEQRDQLLSETSKKYTICVDGRADSTGFSEKYGTYTFMDSETSKILHIELVQSTQIMASNQMELQAFKRGLEFFSNMPITIAKIISDYNLGVVTYLKDKHANIIHEFDSWHVAKNIKTKLTAIGRDKNYRALNLWIPGIINHILWVGATSTTRDERKEKYLSILNHITNVHEGHGKKFRKCQHGPTEIRGDRIWLARGTKLFDKVSEAINSPYILDAIYKLSSKFQNSSVEVFHSVLNSFCPKMYYFTKDSMHSRTYLAAIHYNENFNIKQCTIDKQEEEFRVSDTSSLKPFSTKTTYEYVGKLMQLTYEEAVLHSSATDLTDL